MAIVFPAGCRRVGLSVREGIMQAVWPAVWPAGAMALYVFATRSLVPHHLIAVAIEYGIATSVYALTFVLFAIDSAERQFYVGKILGLVWRRTPRVGVLSESA
jgi:hypothetical protein